MLPGSFSNAISPLRPLPRRTVSSFCAPRPCTTASRSAGTAPSRYFTSNSPLTWGWPAFNPLITRSGLPPALATCAAPIVTSAKPTHTAMRFFFISRSDSECCDYRAGQRSEPNLACNFRSRYAFSAHIFSSATRRRIATGSHEKGSHQCDPIADDHRRRGAPSLWCRLSTLPSGSRKSSDNPPSGDSLTGTTISTPFAASASA